jgi:hypothetical protein
MKDWKDLSSEELQRRVSEKFQLVIIDGIKCSGILRHKPRVVSKNLGAPIKKNIEAIIFITNMKIRNKAMKNTYN